MRSDWVDKLADTYPPTPIAFTMAVKKTVTALPARKSAWRLPLPATVAYALAMCGVAVLLVFGMGPLQAGGVGQTAAPTQTAVSPAPMETAAPTLLPVGSLANAPSSADGWQVVAVAGNATWYYRAKTNDLAMKESAKTITMALNLNKGQTIQESTFLCGEMSQWVAFTVAGDHGDALWVVTEDGYRIIAPDNLPWMDANNNPIQVDLSGAKIMPALALPTDPSVMYWTEQLSFYVCSQITAYTGLG